MTYIVYFGNKLNEDITNHNISPEQWQSALNRVRQSSFWTEMRPNIKYKVYHIQNLIYEINRENSIKCYVKTYYHFSNLTLDNKKCHKEFQNSITYKVETSQLVDKTFEPTNKYYNIYDVERTTFSDTFVKIVFENKNSSKEIYLEHNFDDPKLLTKYFELLMGVGDTPMTPN